MSRLRPFARSLVRDREATWTFALVSTAAYVAMLIWGHAHHEMWRDEIHPWVLGRLADGFWDIVKGDRVYDGHPPLWYWYLRVWGWVTHRPWGLHAATITVMGAAALLFLRFAPFPRLLKLLLLASYVLGYEYGVISRNYSLTWLLIVVFCCVYHPLRPRLVGLSLLLAAVALTSVFGTLMTCGLFLMLVPLGASVTIAPGEPRLIVPQIRPALLIGALIMAATFAFFVYSTRPPDPNPSTPDWSFENLNLDGARAALDRLVYAFLPIRGFRDPLYWGDTAHFWDRHTTLLLVAGLALLVLLPLSLVPQWFESAGLLVATGLMSLFIMVRYGAGMRHMGNFFLLFLGASWIARVVAPRRRHILSTALLVVIGLFQLQSFVAAAGQDKRQVFSGGGEMAAWIEKAGLRDVPIVAGPDAIVLTVTGHLDRPFISSETGEVNQTQVFHSRRVGFSPAGLADRAAREVHAKHHPVLVLADRPVPGPPGLKLTLLHESPGGAGDESFWVYRLTE